MSKAFLQTVILILIAIAATIQWQATLDIEKYQQFHEGDKAIMTALATKLEIQLDMIQIMSQAMKSQEEENRNHSLRNK